MAEQQFQHRFLIGPLTFDPISRELSLAAKLVYLEPQPYQLLSLFISADQGQLSRDQMIEQLWSGRVVSESAINKSVSLLRKAFASLDPATSYIETLPKVGYRLCQPVSAEPVLASSTQQQQTSEAVSKPSAQQPQPLQQLPASGSGIKTKLILAALWTSPLLFFVLWFFITLAPPPEQLSTPYLNAPVPLSHAPGVEYDLSLSKDGSQLLYLSSHSDKKQLILQQSSGKQQLLAEDAAITTAALSPDGLQVLWVKKQQQNCTVEWFLVAAPEQKKAVASCHTDGIVKLAWQSDSNGFYLRDRLDKTQPYFLVHYRLDTLGRQQITTPLTAQSPDGELAFAESDDGSKLAIVRYLENQQSLVLLLDSRTFAILEQHTLPFQSKVVDWLGDQLVLAKAAELLTFNPQTGQLEFLFYAGSTVQSVAVVQQQIYYADYELDADIWQQDLSTGKARIRIGSSKVDRMPRVNQQGDLAFLSQRNGKDQIWLQPQGQNEYLLADLPGVPGFVRMQWSPDGQSLIFSKDGALWHLEVSSGQSRVLIAPEQRVAVANWIADGSGLVYSSKQSGDWQLWHLDLTTAVSVQLTRQGGYSGYLSNGQLYFSKFHQDGLFQLDVATGTEQLLIASFNKINWLNWRLMEDTIYYYQPEQGIRQYQLQSKNNSLLLSPPERFVHHYDLHNQQLFYVKSGLPKGDIYKLEPVKTKTN